MRIRRGTLLGIGLLLAGATALMAYMDSNEPAVPTDKVETDAPVHTNVLYVTRALEPGDRLEDSVTWRERPVEADGSGVITMNEQPDAIKKLATSRARRHLEKGDILTADDLVEDPKSLSLQLHPSKRAMSVRVSADTTAGGFILPNDRVDVIINRERPKSRSDNRMDSSGVPNVITETVVKNVRVLAIDQIKDNNDSAAIIGQTATLELTEKQARILAASEQIAQRIVLVLRSSLENDHDVETPEADGGDHLVYSPEPRGSIRLITGTNITEIGVR